MTVATPVSVYSQVFVPRDYDVFAGLDVDHHSIAATFTDHQRLMKSRRLPCGARQLLTRAETLSGKATGVRLRSRADDFCDSYGGLLIELRSSGQIKRAPATEVAKN